jgi:hypothetical protein
MGNNSASQSFKNLNHLRLGIESRALFDEKGQQEMASIFRKELGLYQSLLNEAFGKDPLQQRQICFLCEALLGNSLYFEVKDLQNALQKLQVAAMMKMATQSSLAEVNQKIDWLLETTS